MRSPPPRPTSVASYQSSSPRLPSPLAEMSDTLSPLRGRLSPETSPAVPQRTRASSFSRSPLASTSPECSPHTFSRQGVPFPTASPLSSPLAPSRPLSPASARSIRSPPRPSTSSHFHLSQGCPSAQIVHARPQSLIQQFRESPPTALVTSDDQHQHRHVSLGAETLHPHSPVTSILTDDRPVTGDATPLNEAPVHWWSGRRNWVDDWDALVAQQYQYHQVALHSPVGMGFTYPESGTPLAFREPFGRDRPGPGPFLDDEIQASLDGNGLVAPLIPNVFHVPMGISSVGCETKDVPISGVMPVPVPLGSTRLNMRSDVAYGEVNIGSPPVEGVLAAKIDLFHDNSCCMHSQRNDDVTPIQEQEPGHRRLPGRKRGISDASTHSNVSYSSCASGPSRGQSQLVLVSSSQSHTSVSPSLASLGIGIEEAEREELRSRSFWRRRNSGSTIKRQNKELGHMCSKDTDQGSYSPSMVQDSSKGECRCSADHRGMQSKPSPTFAHGKLAPKHGSMFFRAGLKQESVEETSQREGYIRAEKYVSLAVTSILPASTITTLSPVGEALVKARDSVKLVGHELAPVVKDTLVLSTNILALVPFPGLEEAAKALLSVWNACQKVDTNRLSCLRLAERCATLLYSVRLEISEAGAETAMALDEPVERLRGALTQIRTFLEAQLHRPFLKRYLRREEIARELVACNEAITDAASKFGMSIQVRTYQVVCAAAYESKRFAQEIHALLALDQEMMRKHYTMSYGHPLQPWRYDTATAQCLDGNALGLMTDDSSSARNGQTSKTMYEGDNVKRGGNGYLTPPPAYGPTPQPLPTATCKLLSSRCEMGSLQNTPTLSASSTGYASDVAEPSVSVPPTPTPTRATFITDEIQATTMATTMSTGQSTKTNTMIVHPTSPICALTQMHWAQDSVDTASDEAALQGTLAGALNARNDVEMIRCLQVGQGEIPEAAETLRRMLGMQGRVADVNKDIEELHSKWQDRTVGGNLDLHRKFMQGGVEAMARLAKVVAKGGHGEGTDEVAGEVELPSWTITRYEVDRTRKIGTGRSSDIYMGRWQGRSVVIKVLANSVSREAFVRHVELWNGLDHQNILPLYGASSAMGEKPWFFVSKFCNGGDLVARLKRARIEAETMEAATPTMDLLKCMHEVAQGMAYLHKCGILHGDLRAENVLVDENGRCVLSNFGQTKIKLHARLTCGQSDYCKLQWKAPEVLQGSGQPTRTADMYAFAMCCVEILGMGDLPWVTLDAKVIHELVVDKDERPPIPVPLGKAEVANAVRNLLNSCWTREPHCRPSFASVAASLKEIMGVQGHGSPQASATRQQHPATPQVNAGGSTTVPPSIESSPADDQYETASESMTTEVEDEDMTDIPLTSPAPQAGFQHASALLGVTAQLSSVVPGTSNTEAPEPPSTNAVGLIAKNEEQYRLAMGSEHPFHSTLTLALWSPTHIELGSVGYLSKPTGEFVTLFNAMNPLQSSEEQLRHLPSVYGYGKFEVQIREEGKRSMAQRGMDAISDFLMFKTRNDRSHPDRVTREYTFPLIEGKAAAYLCVEKTMHRFLDHLDAPSTWFGLHLDRILEVYGPRYGLQKEDLVLVVGALDSPEWALFVSEDHANGRARFNVYAGRERGEPWGVYTVEREVKNNGAAGPVRYVSIDQETFASKVSSGNGTVNDQGGHCDKNVWDTVLLATLQFKQGTQMHRLR